MRYRFVLLVWEPYVFSSFVFVSSILHSKKCNVRLPYIKHALNVQGVSLILLPF